LNRTKLPALLQHCGPCLQLHGSAALLPSATRPAAPHAGVLSGGRVVHGRRRSAGRRSRAPGHGPPSARRSLASPPVTRRRTDPPYAAAVPASLMRRDGDGRMDGLG